MAIGRVNVGGGKGGKLNVFSQLTEPAKKEGIWLKTDKAYKKIIVDTKFYFAGEWIDPNAGIYEDIPSGVANSNNLAVVGTDIYLMGGLDQCYKYDTLTDTYTKISAMPFPFNGGGNTVSIGTDIYLLGSHDSKSNVKNYKYNTLTGTYTELANLPVSFSNGAATALGTDIYFFGSSYSSSGSSRAFKYNTLDNTYSFLPNVPNKFEGEAITIGTDIYLFAHQGATSIIDRYIYKYDTETQTYTQLQDLPEKGTFPAVISIGTDIYILTGSLTYKYDTTSEAYTKLPDNPSTINSGDGACFVRDKIYAFNFYGVGRSLQVLPFVSKQYDENTVVLFRTSDQLGQYYTELVSPGIPIEGELFNRTASGFNDAFLFADGDLKRPPAYYGDGTKWIQFRI